MKKLIYFLTGAFGFLMFQNAYAVCPVCTVAVGAGVGLARYLGVDDTVSGVWIGGLLASLILWTLNWFENKKINFKGKEVVVIAIYLGLIIAPLIWADIVGHPANKLWGFDKLLLGVVVGSFGFILANFLYEWTKKRNGNKALFPFQKVAMPILFLLIISLIFYLITK